jgi:hypothetical protein
MTLAPLEFFESFNLFIPSCVEGIPYEFECFQLPPSLRRQILSVDTLYGCPPTKFEPEFDMPHRDPTVAFSKPKAF